MKLAAAVCQGSNTHNEDGWGYLGMPEDVSAAWIFDGVTGINGRNYIPGGSDAQWLVARAHDHLLRLAAVDMALPDLLVELVLTLISDWHAVSRGVDLPDDYDPPAACLVLAKRYGHGWQALRLGDSCLLARCGDGAHRIAAASLNNAFDNWLAREAASRRDEGVLDIKALLAEFRPQLKAGRKKRNTADGYSILEANEAALEFAECLDLATPSDILLCTDGYYRAVDHYGLYDDVGLLAASAEEGGTAHVLRQIRDVEAGDPACQNYPRFKPFDDATAVLLRSSR